ncbi:hypothetical protein [Desulfosarcina sp.]|uniref:hypothetical protein n=1 Tax=Desulfosarcina sp. TaxID=2027861 RepID=UPI0029A69B0F|nr:hypothetical protein [Desulfosarcina sp.]MDX2452407.1 hypothetical protein [Desulfosarcina sp.]MDX2490184.1 hypothetical protein [Desulfosarcina sp.]
MDLRIDKEKNIADIKLSGQLSKKAILDELVKSRISDGFVKSPRSRLAGRDSELERANNKSIAIHSANIHVPS